MMAVVIITELKVTAPMSTMHLVERAMMMIENIIMKADIRGTKIITHTNPNIARTLLIRIRVRILDTILNLVRSP